MFCWTGLNWSVGSLGRQTYTVLSISARTNHELESNISKLKITLGLGLVHVILNVEVGVECQIFVIVIFFNCNQVLQFGINSRYYKGALTQKRSFFVICTTFRTNFHVGWKKIKTFNTKFVKWHDPDITKLSTKPKTIREHAKLESVLLVKLFQSQLMKTVFLVSIFVCSSLLIPVHFTINTCSMIFAD